MITKTPLNASSHAIRVVEAFRAPWARNQPRTGLECGSLTELAEKGRQHSSSAIMREMGAGRPTEATREAIRPLCRDLSGLDSALLLSPRAWGKWSSQADSVA